MSQRVVQTSLIQTDCSDGGGDSAENLARQLCAGRSCRNGERTSMDVGYFFSRFSYSVCGSCNSCNMANDVGSLCTKVAMTLIADKSVQTRVSSELTKCMGPVAHVFRVLE